MTRTFKLAELLVWMEHVLDNRLLHLEEWYDIFTSDTRKVGFVISDEGVLTRSSTNQDIDAWEWLTDKQEQKLIALGWNPRPARYEPSFDKEWAFDTPTKEIVAEVMLVLTSIYLHRADDTVDVLRGLISEGHVDWEEDSPWGRP